MAAMAYARLACELTESKDYIAVGALAAACAEAGDYDSAVKWQTTAIEITPAAEKQDAIDRLDLFRNKKPYRWNTHDKFTSRFGAL
jgi:hypothetical protein